MRRQRTRPEDRKVKTGVTLNPNILAQLDRFRGSYSRSGVVEGIVASYLDMAAEEGITNFEELCKRPVT